MKLRNKLTGEIGEPRIEYQKIYVYTESNITHCYNTLRGMFNEWEDYEEPKEFFIISPYKIDGYEVLPYNNFEHIYNLAEELGIGFETKEEAEKAVEKLKAWKRLKDKGFKFYGWNKGSLLKDIPNNITFACDDTRIWAWEDIQDDLDLLFNEQEHIRKKAQKIVEDNADYYDKFEAENE